MQGEPLHKKILVIEDEAAMRQILVDKFAWEGFTVLTAVDGEEGLQVSLREHPDLIVLDILLPKMDGLTMLRALGEDEWGREVPVVVFTNVSEASGITPTMKKNVVAFLPKAESDINALVGVVKDRLGAVRPDK